MLFLTLALLLHTMSSGMTATLGNYKSDEYLPEEAPVPDSAKVEAYQQQETVVNNVPVAEALVAHEPAEQTEVVPDASPPLTEGLVIGEPDVGEPDVDTPNPQKAVPEEPVREDIDTVEGQTEEALAQETSKEEAPYEHTTPEETPADVKGNEIKEVPEIFQSELPSAKLEDSTWGLNSIRDSFQAVNGYFDSLVELVGGRNGVCQYRCKYDKAPVHRHGYQIPKPNGCSSSLLGFQYFDLGVPAMTKCCDLLDTCYDTCGNNKYRCDTKFRWCVRDICADLKRSLGFVSKVEACEAVADALYNTVWTLGCRPYLTSQRAACSCEGEERDEL